MRYSRIVRLGQAMVIPLLGLAMVVFLDNRVRGGFFAFDHATKVVAIGYILVGSALAYRLICDAVLDIAVRRATGRQVPKILRHLVGMAIVITAAMMVVNVLYPGALTSLLALSSVMAVVIGFALRPLILDVFSGVSANLDSAFHIGDWIEIRDRSGETHSGWVEEMNWRTTQLRTRSGDLVVCPNSTLSTAVIVNFSRPTRFSRFGFKLKLPPELDPDRACRLLKTAASAAVMNDGYGQELPAPDVLVTRMEASGVEYWVRFWLDPARDSVDSALDEVSRSVLRHLRFAGIPLSEDVVLHRRSRPLLDTRSTGGLATAFSHAALFDGISRMSLESLASKAVLAFFKEGETLIRQGDADSDMFLLVEGAVRVSVSRDGGDLEVATLKAGDYFGEMSLLTGEPRTATIRALTPVAVYRISREAISPVLDVDPGMMEMLSRNLAERNLGRETRMAQGPGGGTERPAEGLARELLGRMLSIFRISR